MSLDRIWFLSSTVLVSLSQLPPSDSLRSFPYIIYTWRFKSLFKVSSLCFVSSTSRPMKVFQSWQFGVDLHPVSFDFFKNHLQIICFLLLFFFQVHIRSRFILNGVCAKWRGWVDLDRLDGVGCVEFDEEAARVSSIDSDQLAVRPITIPSKLRSRQLTSRL